MRREQTALAASMLFLMVFTLPFTIGNEITLFSDPFLSTTIVVDPNGNGDHTTIQSAIDAASDGDTIRVWNGTFTTSNNVYRSLNIVGNGTDGSIMDGQNTLDHQHLFHVSADRCNISGFQFKRSSIHHEFGGVGLYSSGNVISENLFQDSNNGIYLAGATGNLILNNTFKRNERGIRAELGSDDNEFSGNLFEDNINYGFYYERSGGSHINNNTFESNRRSVFLGYNVNNLTFTGNTFNNSLNRSGLALTYCLDSLVQNNTFTGNQMGIMIAMESHRNLVRWNNITENIEGIRIYKMYDHLGSCTNNDVNYNLIHNNTQWGLNASWTGGGFTNATNNWWGNSTGPYHATSNSPGTGDNVSDNVTFIPWLGGEPINYPPMINDTGALFAIEDEEFFMVFNGSDPEGDDLTWDLRSEIDWITWNPNNLSIIGTPLNDDVGNGSITLRLTDPFDAYDEISIDLFVHNVAPIILGHDKPFAVEDLVYENDYTSTDDGQGNITWSIETNSSWLEINSTDGMLSGTPVNGDLGEYWVNITVSDGNGGKGHRNFTVTVRNTNDPPISLVPYLDIQMVEDIPYSINLSTVFSDPDGDELDHVVYHQGHVTVMIYDDGTMDLIPDIDWSGYENFTLYARDPYVEISIEVNVTVTGVNDAPTDALIIAPDGPFYEATNYTFSGSGKDVDIPFGDVLTYTWSLNSTGEVGVGQEVVLNLTSGNYTLELNVTDMNGTWSRSMIQFQVLPTIVINETEPDDNTTEPDDDDEEPVDDDDVEPSDDDDDEEPVDDDDLVPSDDDVKDESVDPLMVLIPTILITLLVLLLVLIVFIVIRKENVHDEE